jgi:thiol-disulfide isomerase/thioredoxin
MTRTTTARLAALGLAAMTVLAACSGGGAAATPADAPAMSDAPATPGEAMASGEPAMSVDPMMPAEPAMSEQPAMSDEPMTSDEPAPGVLDGEAWAIAALTDVATGETFTIASLAGKPVFVEAMAIWCTNCRAQQGRFTEAFARIPAGTAEYVVLTIDPSETADDLARYKADRGFTGRYAVAGKQLSKALEAAFGPNVINAPSVPLIFITPSGEVTFSTGAESVDEIVARAGG